MKLLKMLSKPAAWPGPAICRTHAVTFYAANLSVPDTVSLFCFQNRF